MFVPSPSRSTTGSSLEPLSSSPISPSPTRAKLKVSFSPPCPALSTPTAGDLVTPAGVRPHPKSSAQQPSSPERFDRPRWPSKSCCGGGGEMVVVSSGGGGNAWAKEMTIRRRMASIFNKTQDHFPSLKDYNDYLEEVEDMTFNLIEGIDIEEIEAKIARYQQENAEQIYLSRAKRAEDLAAALKASRMNPGKAGASDTAAGSSQGISSGAGVQSQYAPAAVGMAQPRPTGMAPQPIGGSSDPLQGDDEETMRLRAERGARAGGWTIEMGKRRALEEAFSSIFI